MPKPVEPKPAAPISSSPEKTAVFKTAAAEALAAIARFAAKAPVENLAAAKPGVSDAPAAAQLPAPEPAQPVAAPARPAVAPEPPPAKPVDASRPPALVKPVPAKPIEGAPPQAAASRAADAPPSTPPKPVAPPEPPPAPTKRVAPPPPPGARIGAADPYPVDVLFTLTSALQGMPAIETAHLAQVELPGRPPHLLVALGTSENWEPLMQELGPRLRRALPSGRSVEFTPLTGGMFEDHFRNETQPFFKRR
jgi:hypothetical protein